MACGWKRDGDALSVDVTVPVNTTAHVYLPNAVGNKVTEGGKDVAQSEGVKFVRNDGRAAVYEVGSGKYTFRVEK